MGGKSEVVSVDVVPEGLLVVVVIEVVVVGGSGVTSK